MRIVPLVKLKRYSVRALTVFVLLIQMCSQQTLGQVGQQVNESVETPHALIAKLRSIIGKSHDSVEIQLHGSCAVADSEIISVPSVLWNYTKGETDHAAAIRIALGRNEEFSVARVSPHVIVIKNKAVRQDLLESRTSVNFTKLERYSPEVAIAAAIDSKAIQRTLRHLNMRLAVRVTGLQHLNSGSEPHLEHQMKNVTLNDVLHTILEKFGGFIVYEDCTDPQGNRRFDILYYQ